MEKLEEEKQASLSSRERRGEKYTARLQERESQKSESHPAINGKEASPLEKTKVSGNSVDNRLSVKEEVNALNGVLLNIEKSDDVTENNQLVMNESELKENLSLSGAAEADDACCSQSASDHNKEQGSDASSTEDGPSTEEEKRAVEKSDHELHPSNLVMEEANVTLPGMKEDNIQFVDFDRDKSLSEADHQKELLTAENMSIEGEALSEADHQKELLTAENVSIEGSLNPKGEELKTCCPDKQEKSTQQIVDADSKSSRAIKMEETTLFKNPKPVSGKDGGAGKICNDLLNRAEIDTAAPFESVKAAVSLFGERVEWKSQLRTSTMKKRAVVHSNRTKVQEELAYQKGQLALTQESVASILVELGKIRALIESLNKKAGEGTDAHPASDGQNLEDGTHMGELLAVLAEINRTKERLLLATESKKEAADGLHKTTEALNSITKKVEELREEQVSVSDALTTTQIALVEAEEQIEELNLNNSAEFQGKVMKDIRDGNSGRLKDLEMKLDEANSMVAKLTEEILEMKKTERETMAAEGEVQSKIENLKSELEQVKSTEMEAVAALSKILQELDDVKVKIEKAADEESSLSSEIQMEKFEIEKTEMELESMHLKEQAACAIMASLQDELVQVRDALASVHASEAAAKHAKDALPSLIKQLAAEADEAKALAEIAREDIRKARHETEEAMAATSTANSRLQAALKECEAARASEAMALAEIKGLTESESKGDNLELEPESVASVTLSLEEYSSLKGVVYEAEEDANMKVAKALLQVEASRASLLAAQEKLHAVRKEAEACKDEMQKVQKKADKAQAAKLAAEGELRQWRAEHEQRRKAGHIPLPPKQAVASNPSKVIVSEDVSKYVVKDGGQSEKRVVGLDSLAQILSLNVPTPERFFTKDLHVEEVVNDKLKTKKKTFMARVASFFVRKRSLNQVLTK